MLMLKLYKDDAIELKDRKTGRRICLIRLSRKSYLKYVPLALDGIRDVEIGRTGTDLLANGQNGS